MNVEVIAIGDELLIGQVVNTNASWLGEHLNLQGLKLVQSSTVGDSKKSILQAIEQAKERADVILMTGGLGPTRDDITKNVLCEYFNTGYRTDAETLKHIEWIFSQKGRVVTELNRKQAEVPANCIVVKNEKGTAPGMWFEFDGKVLISMPGVPYEMKAMMQNHVLPVLSKRFGNQSILHRTIHTVGIPESYLADALKDFENELPASFSLAYLPKAGMVRLRLSAHGIDKNELEVEMNALIEKLNQLIGKYIFSFEEESLEEVVGKLLLKLNSTVSVAESCTGGYLGSLISSVSGSSAYFMGGIISYSNEAKIGMLSVDKNTIEKYGAVSENTVIEMAKGARNKFGTDYSISISGIAGPNGGTADKPVGTVWIGLATPERVFAERFQFGEDRKNNVSLAAVYALNLLRHELTAVYHKTTT